MSVATYTAEEAAILEHIQDNWNTTPIAFPNRKFDPDGAAYIEPRFNPQDAINADIGTQNTIRHTGLLTIDIRVPVNTGWITAKGYADTLAALFRNTALQNIHFRAPKIRNQGREGPWHWVQVDCGYTRDSIH